MTWLIVLSEVAQNLNEFVGVDYRVRTQVRKYLEINHSKHQNQPFATNVAFQLAFCCHVGFGVKSNDNTCCVWLDKSDKQPDDLKAEENAVQLARWKIGRMQGYEDLFRWTLFMNIEHRD